MGKTFFKSILLIVLLLILIIAISGCDKQYHYSSKTFEISSPIKSLGLNNDISGFYGGNFLIGVGSLDTNTYYYVYVDAGDGRYILKKYNAETTYIKESDGQPKVVENIKYFVTDNDSENFTVDGNRFMNDGFLLPDYKVENIHFTKNDTFNDNYDIVAQHIKLQKNQVLFVSTENNTTLYVPRGTIKVKFNADVNSANTK